MNYKGCTRKFDVEAFVHKFTHRKRKLDLPKETKVPKKKSRK